MRHASLYTMNQHRMRLEVDACIDRDFAVSQRVLFPETAAVLAKWCNDLSYRPSGDMRVYQHFEQAGFQSGRWPPELAWLVEGTESVVLARARARVRHGLMRWRVNDISIQRYNDSGAGIEWHRDFASDKHLVVIFSICGAARIEVEDWAGRRHGYQLLPGALTLLSGPDTVSQNDPRLRHRIGPPLTSEPRVSIALRMKEQVQAAADVLAA